MKRNELLGFDVEQNLLASRGGEMLLIGVDEAGRGPLVGPVVASAVCYKQSDFAIPESLMKDIAFIRDSKTLSEKKREAMYELIREHFFVGVGVVSAETIDRINILQAAFLAMKEAISDLRRVLREEGVSDANLLLLVDGNQKIPNISLAQEAIVGGDAKVKSIAAASIVAKVTRDKMLAELDVKYPQYGFAKHKGYGTKVHMEALRKFGPIPEHRKSFAPVKKAILELKDFGIEIA